MSVHPTSLDTLTKPQLQSVLRLTDALCNAATSAALLSQAIPELQLAYPVAISAFVIANANRKECIYYEHHKQPETSQLADKPYSSLLSALLALVDQPDQLTLTRKGEDDWQVTGEAVSHWSAGALGSWLTDHSGALAALRKRQVRQLTGFPIYHDTICLGLLVLGTTEPVEVTNRVYLDQLITCIGRAWDRVQAVESSMMQQQQQELLFALSEKVATIRDVADLFQVLFDKVKPLFGFHDAAVILRQPDGQHYRHLATNAAQQIKQRPTYAQVGRLSPVAGSPHAPFFEAANPTPMLLDLAEVHRDYPEHWESIIGQELNFKQRFWVPLRLPDRMLGTLEFVSDQANFFTPQHFPLAQTIGDLLAVAVGNCLANEEIEKREKEKAWQLAVGTVLVSSQDRATMVPALAAEISKAVSCHYFEMHFGGPLTSPQAVWQLRRQTGEDFAPVSPADAVIPAPAQVALEADVADGVYIGPAMDELIGAIPRFGQLHEQEGMWSLIRLALPPTRCGEGGYLLLGNRTPFAYLPADVDRMTLLLPQLVLVLNSLAAFEQIAALSQQLTLEKTYLTEEVERTHNGQEMVGQSPALLRVLQQVQLVAPTDATVLINGETGTGKELIARALHNLSPRRERVLVTVNCAALPPQLIESELFGHEKGAFTGAVERRIGKFELAQNSTIFLDEIGELPLELQAKLLRVLQSGEFERVGGKTTVIGNFRVLAATNRDLKQEMEAGRFRADLYYRLSTFPLFLPPLRERPEDIPQLAQFFAQKFARKMGRSFQGIQPEAIQELLHYTWPGNIRELENVVEQAVIVCGGAPLQWARPLVPFVKVGEGTPFPTVPATNALSPFTEIERQRIFALLYETKGRVVGPQGVAQRLGMYPYKLRGIEREFLQELLSRTGGRIRGETGAAAVLGVKPTTLEARLKKLELKPRPQK